MTIQATTTQVATPVVAQAPITPATPPVSSQASDTGAATTTEKVLGFFANIFGTAGGMVAKNQQLEGMDKQREAKAYGDSVNPAKLAVQYNGYLQAEALNNQCGSLDAEGRRPYGCGSPLIG